MRDAASGLLHDSDTAQNGLMSSLTHQYTSDYWGNPITTSPSVPAAPQAINLFSVYSGGDWSDYFDR